MGGVSVLLFVAAALWAQEPASPGSPQQTPSSAAPATAQAQSNASPAQAPAQTPGQPPRNSDGTYTIRSNARLVVLDVVVSDAKGKVVTGLQKSDFHVTEAGEDQTIQNFEEAGSRSVGSDITINSTAELDQLAPRAPVNIVLLDEFNTRFEDMAFARYSLKKYLEKQPDRLTTPTMLIAVSLQNFTVVHDYTQNKQELLASLDHHFVAYPWQLHQGAWVAERYGTAFGTLMRVAEASVGHVGHKNMIWIGRGFPSINLANVAVDQQNRLNSVVQETVNLLRDARVTLYSIDPAGVMIDPGVYGRAATLNDPLGGNYQFNELARATGGKSLYGRNDVDAEIGTSIQDGANFYTLTYRPSDTSLSPLKFRKIKVTIDRPDATALTRQGYYLQGRPRKVDPMNPTRRLKFDLASAGTSTMVYDGLPVTAKASTAAPGEYVVHVDARGVVWTFATETAPRHTEVIVTATTFDKKGKPIKEEGKLMKVNAPKDAPPTGRIEQSLDLPWKLAEDGKAVRVRFVVRMNLNGRLGTVDLPLGDAAQAP